MFYVFLSLRMNYPPSKRLRGLAPGLDPVLDPFEEDFTQDDLDEIDVIASQAITTATGGGAEPSVGRHNSELGEFSHGALLESILSPFALVRL